jgi:hypothetical protein
MTAADTYVYVSLRRSDTATASGGIQTHAVCTCTVVDFVTIKCSGYLRCRGPL